MGSGANSFHNRMDVLGNKLREKEIRIPINMRAGVSLSFDVDYDAVQRTSCFEGCLQNCEKTAFGMEDY